MEAEFITANIHIESDADFPSEYRDRLLIALSPRGVAALPIPKKFAVIFIATAPQTSLSFFASGIRKPIRGLNTMAMIFTSPLFSAIFIIPVQKQIFPIKLRTNVVAV